MEKRKVLVSGATGQQGGSVVLALLNDGHEVVGITRNTESPKAKNLLEQNVEMVSVDFTDSNELINIMKKVDTVFAMTTPFEGGIDHEVQQGISMANAAKEAGIGHFIFNSVGDANQPTGIPHFDSKYEVEKHLETLGMAYTIVAPAYFMDNIFIPFMLEQLKEGLLKMAMPADRKLQQISVEDIGKFVGIVVNEREAMFGDRVNISGDELTGEEVSQILTKAIGKKIQYEGYNPDYLREQSEDMALMYEWFNDKGYTADLNSLKKYGFMSFEDWALKQDWSTII